MRHASAWAWLWLGLGIVYFLVPLLATFEFSLRATKDVLGFAAYANVFGDPRFAATFSYSAMVAALTILGSALLVVPTAFLVRWRLPGWRSTIEFMTLLPFVIPAIVLVFGLIRLYSGPPLFLTRTDLSSTLLLVASYVVLSLPYMYRAVDTGLRAIDVRTLTEAALSLGAGWPAIFFSVILPNIRVALLSGAFLTFATVIGEFTIAVFLARPAFGPYMAVLGQDKAYEPAALAIVSFVLTWASIGLIQLIGRGPSRQAQLAGAR
jgi:putative spermidine/putrescine transport system permease protein